MSVSRPAVVAALAVAVGGCSGDQSALGPQVPGAEFILDLFWLFLSVCTAVFLLVVLGLGYALRRRHPAPTGPLERDGRFKRSAARLVAGLVAATAVVLVTLTGASYFTGRSLAGIGDGEPLTIRVTGRQWWWELRYENDDPSRVLMSATFPELGHCVDAIGKLEQTVFLPSIAFRYYGLFLHNWHAMRAN